MRNEDNDRILTKKLKLLNYINNIDNNQVNKFIILIKLIQKEYSKLTIAIKTPNPIDDKKWGDYFFAVSLKKSLEKKGFNVVIHEREYWYEDDFDISIVLRGLINYNPKPYHLNLMWNISHPNIVSLKEYEKYDVVFVASNNFAENLCNKINTLVHPLLQCTDPEKFRYQKNSDFDNEILFVGFSKGNVSRKIIKDILKTNHDFSVYGFGWEEFLDDKYIKGQFIDNNILNEVYSNCKILLNDHWEDMVEKDFVSNRIFDALACKTFVISDYVESIQTLFEGNVITYTNPQDLNEKLNYYLTHDYERKAMANKGCRIVLKNHTFDNRVSELLEVIEKNYFFEFMKEIYKNSNKEHSFENILIDYSNMLNDDYNKLVDENKSLTVKIARLQERIYFLEHEKLFKDERNKKTNKSFFKFFKIV